MTIIRPNSISGVSSITGSGGDISIFRADGTAADVIVNNITSGVITATHYGSGANLTNLPAANLTGALPAISAANLTSIPAANITGTLPAISAANLTNIPAANITGTLPAIDGSALTGVGVGTADSINTSGIVTATAFVPTEGQLSHRNMIINGEMSVAQRATSSSGSFTTAAYPTCDRWKFGAYATDQLSMTITQEAMNSVNGFGNYLKMSPGTAESGGAANEYVNMRYTIEAQDCQQLQWGTLSAKSATLSFWVKSNVTGTACVNFTKNDSTSYQITRTYTINVANTWEYKTLTIPGLTASGIANDTGAGITIYWFLDAGSDYKSSNSTSWGTFSDGGYAYGHSANFIDSTSTNWNITGVQFEVGSVATPFEHRSFGDELRRCQRYYQKDLSRNRRFWGSGNVSNRQFPVRFDVAMRDTPSVSFPSSSLDSGSPSANGINKQGYYFNMSGSGRFYEWQHIANAEI